MISFLRTNSDNTHFRELVTLLDEDLHQRDGQEHAFYAQFNKIANIRHAIVCFNGQDAVGCGAFKAYDENTVEIKRMFVMPAYRGQGIGLQILKELEKWAAELHYAATVLETGKRQPEAIRLYQKAGYALIKNFGQYENVENSVCMRKPIS